MVMTRFIPSNASGQAGRWQQRTWNLFLKRIGRVCRPKSGPRYSSRRTPLKCRNSRNENSSNTKPQVLKYTKYIKIVSKYGLGVDLDTYLVPATVVAVLVLMTTFGISGLLLLGALGLGIILAAALVFLSVGWLFLPLLAFGILGAFVGGLSTLFLLPMVGIAVGFGALSILSQLTFSQMDDESMAEALDSLDEDGRFSQMELERFDQRMSRRNR